MKKILLAIALLLPALSFADGVSQEQALKVAETYLSAKTTRSLAAPALNLKWTGGSNVQTRAGQEPAFYVFDNSAGGFVIVAGDDCVEPILAYSNEGQFVVEGMPDNIKYWFDHLQEGIAYLRAAGFTPSARVQSQWKAYRSGVAPVAMTRAGEGKLLETAAWSQGEPYNLKASEWCNINGGEPVHSGCVATATAIIMRYHKYPERGSGTIGGYTYDKGEGVITVRSYELGHTYDWDSMPLKDGSWSDYQKEQVATLVRDCGIMCEMHYGTYSNTGSSAVTSAAPDALVKYMGYDRSRDALKRDYYEQDVWLGKIIENIDNNCPVLLNGKSASGGGHAFVLDGYNSEKQIRINWGWGSLNNAFYTMPDFGGYRYDQTAFVNIKPDAGGVEVTPFIVQTGFEYTEDHKIDTEKKQITVYTNTQKLANGSGAIFHGSIVLVHTDSDYNFKSIIKTINTTADGLRPSYKYGDTEANPTFKMSDIEDGDMLKWFYKIAGTAVYLPVQNSVQEAGELLLPSTADYFDIEEETSVEYAASKNKLIIRTHTALQYTLKSSTNAEITSGTELNKGVLTIDLESLADGTYTLTLNVGKNSKELKFTVGQ